MLGEKKKMLVASYILPCLAIILLGLAIAESIVKNIYAEAIANIKEQIAMNCSEVSTLVTNKMHAAQVLAEEAGQLIQGPEDTAGFRAFAEDMYLLYNTGMFDGLGIIDRDKTLYAFQQKTYDAQDVPSVDEALAGKSFISPPFLSKETGQPIVVFYAPVYQEGRIIGVIVGSQQVAHLERTLTKDFYRGLGYCHIVNNAGEVILHSVNPASDQHLTNLFDKIRSFMPPEESKALVATMQEDFVSGRQNIVHLKKAKDKQIVGYMSVPSYTDWNVICIIEERKLWGASMPLLIKILALTSGAVVILLLFLTYLNLNRRHAQLRLEQVAYGDEITGGKNLHYFQQQAPILLQKNKNTPYFILRFDIDRFKHFNNSFGYAMGDQLLKALYQLVSEFYPPEKDQLVARMYSDEFVVLAQDTGELDPICELYGLMSHVGSRIGLTYVLHFSLGIYRIADNAEPLEDMLNKAHLAQRYYKENRLERSYLYSETLLQAMTDDSTMESHMEASLQNNEFLVYLQPKIELKQEKVCGAEALVRWNSQVFGFMPPGKFIPLFEKNGFIQRLDFFVLESVCRFLRQRLDAGQSLLPISVNQSRLHSYDPLYLERLQTMVARYNIPPAFIELEITESVLLENMERVEENIRAVRQLGFRISIDDFGSGYTSLHFLQDVEVDVIKMDRSLLAGAEVSAKRRKILQYLIAMSHALGMEVVCEGIETAEQVALIRSVGGDVAQGYYYGRPMPQEAFSQYVAQQENSST